MPRAEFDLSRRFLKEPIMDKAQIPNNEGKVATREYIV